MSPYAVSVDGNGMCMPDGCIDGSAFVVMTAHTSAQTASFATISDVYTQCGMHVCLYTVSIEY